jgi:hypothetical protein
MLYKPSANDHSLQLWVILITPSLSPAPVEHNVLKLLFLSQTRHQCVCHDTLPWLISASLVACKISTIEMRKIYE